MVWPSLEATSHILVAWLRTTIVSVESDSGRCRLLQWLLRRLDLAHDERAAVRIAGTADARALLAVFVPR